MAFTFTGWIARLFGTELQTQSPRVAAVVMSQADGTPDLLQSNGAGAAQVSDAALAKFQPNAQTAVVPADATVVSFNAIWVGTGGDVYLKMAKDNAYVRNANVPSGTLIQGDIIGIGSSTGAGAIVGYSRL